MQRATITLVSACGPLPPKATESRFLADGQPRTTYNNYVITTASGMSTKALGSFSAPAGLGDEAEQRNRIAETLQLSGFKILDLVVIGYGESHFAVDEDGPGL